MYLLFQMSKGRDDIKCILLEQLSNKLHDMRPLNIKECKNNVSDV